ncbi:hypothetical protein EON62_00750, partial [archaeon]
HPGIASIMMSDLTTLRVIVNVVAYLEPEFDFRPVIAEWASEAVKELDFRREAAITMHAGATLAQAQLHCAVPGVVPLAAVSSAVARDVTAAPNVLLLEHVDGVKVTDVAALTAAGADLAQLMLDICEAFSVQMHVDGCFHGDPHAGNLLVRLPALGSGRSPATTSGVHREPFTGGERSAPTVSNLVRAQPVLLDWGLTKILTDRHRLAFCSMAVAASESDGGALLDSFDAMGLKLNREAPHEDLNNIQFLMRDAAPATQARAAIMAQRAVWKARVAARAAAGAPRRPVDAWPTEILFYLRTGEMLHGLAATLQVHLAYSSVMAKYARTALRGHAAATWLVQQPAAAHTPALKPLLPAATLRVPPSGVHDVVVLDSARSHACAAMCAMMRRAAVPGVMPVFARVPATFSSAVEERVYVLLRQLWISGAIVGAQVAVYQAGARLVDASFGELGGNNVRPVTSATLFNVFSVSKAVTATLLHVLMDRIHQREAQPAAAAHETSASTLAQEYGALVSAFWPAFVPPSAGGGASPSAVALKRRTTLVHVLQHTAGLQHAIPADVNMSKFVDCEAMMRALEEAVPDTIPGVHTSYHYYTFGWLVAGLVRGMQARALGSDAAHLSFAECLYHALLAPAGLAREMLMSLPYPSSDGSGEDVDASRVATLAGDFSSMGGVAVGTSASSLAPELATAAEVARYDASPSGIDSHDGAPTPARSGRRHARRRSGRGRRCATSHHPRRPALLPAEPRQHRARRRLFLAIEPGDPDQARACLWRGQRRPGAAPHRHRRRAYPDQEQHRARRSDADRRRDGADGRCAGTGGRARHAQGGADRQFRRCARHHRRRCGRGRRLCRPVGAAGGTGAIRDVGAGGRSGGGAGGIQDPARSRRRKHRGGRRRQAVHRSAAEGLSGGRGDPGRGG